MGTKLEPGEVKVDEFKVNRKNAGANLNVSVAVDATLTSLKVTTAFKAQLKHAMFTLGAWMDIGADLTLATDIRASGLVSAKADMAKLFDTISSGSSLSSSVTMQGLKDFSVTCSKT